MDALSFATRSRITRLSTLTLAAVAAVLLAATSAYAVYSHHWGRSNQNENCTYYAAYRPCYDRQGQIFNAWVYGYMEVDWGYQPGNFNGICIKAQTSDGTPKGGNICSNGIQWKTTTFAASPSSWAYGYWGGTTAANPQSLFGEAST